MALQHVSISIPPRMARFIRRKAQQGVYSDAGEVVRTALLRMEAQEDPSTRDATVLALTAADMRLIRERVRAGIDDLEQGRYTEYRGRKGLERLAAGVKSRVRRRLKKRTGG